MGKNNKKTQEEENPDLKIKRLHLEKEEVSRIQAIQSVTGILTLLRQGLNNSLYLELAKAKQRLHLDTPESMKAPEGWERIIDFDPSTYEMLIVDQKIPDTVNDTPNADGKPKN